MACTASPATAKSWQEALLDARGPGAKRTAQAGNQSQRNSIKKPPGDIAPEGKLHSEKATVLMGGSASCRLPSSPYP